MKFSKTQIILSLALLSSNAIILWSSPDWLWLRLPAALALLWALPGWAWSVVFGWFHTDDGLERLVLVGGVGSLLAAPALLVAVLLRGPFTEPVVWATLNLLTVAGLVVSLVVGRRDAVAGPLRWPARRVLLALLAIVAVAALGRVYHLGYAEFHEDELENMRLIIRAFKGEEYAPFLDSKGPIHWLVPAALWFLNGWGNEAIARAPFSATALLLIPLMFVLGRRMTGRDAVGLAAAGFVALNGFFVAYARHVENPSLIVFWGALTVWWAYRYYKEGIVSFLPWVGLSAAVGLITHPDVLLYLPVFGAIVALKAWQERAAWRAHLPWLAGGGLLFIALTGLFYVPYLTDPNIAAVREYFAEERIGTAYLYNRMANLFDQDQLYSSRFHAPLLVLLLGWLLTRQFAQWGRRGYLLLAALVLAMAATLIWPEAWLVAGQNMAFVPYALLTLLVLALPKTSVEIKFLFLWLMAPLGALLFLAQDAADHIQIAYTAWALLAGIALVDIWDTVGNTPRLTPATRRMARGGLAVGLALLAGLIVYYQYLMFLTTVTRYWAIKTDYETNPNSMYGQVYGSIPRPRKIFSNPRFGGWKAVGYLWNTSQLGDDFRSINESYAVPIWYTFETPRSCYNDPQNYWVRRDIDGWPTEADQLPEQGYAITRVVLVDGQPKLRLYEKGAPSVEPEILDVEDYRHPFDRLATPANFAAGDQFEQPVSLNFGDKLLLQGFTLPATASPGRLLPVSLYWQALAPMDVRYRAFVHLVGADGATVAQHDDDPACRLITPDMRPGMLSTRQFRLPIDPQTPPGEYQVVIGLYHPDTFERLSIWDNEARNSPGDSFVIGTVRVE